jgi:hypothetical protein
MSKARDIASAAPAPSTVSATELGYVDGVTSAIQTQLDAKTAKSTLTTTGDIYYASAANTPARLGIGSTDQVLKVTAGIPAWATPAASGTSWTLLNSGGTALTGAATVTVSGISGKNKIMVIVTDASSATNASFIKIQLNTDTGSNYYWVGNRITSSSAYNSNNLFGTNGFPSDGIIIGRMSGNDLSSVFGYVLIDACNTTGVKTFEASGGGDAASNSSQSLYNIGGYYNSASTISSVSINSSVGNLDAGTVYVYTSAS